MAKARQWVAVVSAIMGVVSLYILMFVFNDTSGNEVKYPIYTITALALWYTTSAVNKMFALANNKSFNVGALAILFYLIFIASDLVYINSPAYIPTPYNSGVEDLFAGIVLIGWPIVDLFDAIYVAYVHSKN